MLLHEIGFSDQHVRLQVYGHELASTDAVVEWTKGTTLLRFQKLLPEELFDPFVERYRQRLREVARATSRPTSTRSSASCSGHAWGRMTVRAAWSARDNVSQSGRRPAAEAIRQARGMENDAADQFHFDPATYLDMVLTEIPAYLELQEATAEATAGLAAETNPRARCRHR